MARGRWGHSPHIKGSRKMVERASPPRRRDDEFDTSWQARADVLQREREEREAKEFGARARARGALPETDHDRDAAHDSGEDEWQLAGRLFR